MRTASILKIKSLFEVAGADGIYFTAKAKIKKNTVVVAAKEVGEPVSVRFAWANTAISNVFNAAQLPLSSFKSR
jgi:sialate O-acetylesterase